MEKSAGVFMIRLSGSVKLRDGLGVGRAGKMRRLAGSSKTIRLMIGRPRIALCVGLATLARLAVPSNTT